jgi:hypothetical protein
MQQEAVDREDRATAMAVRSRAALETAAAETLIGAYGGAPYTYPSDITFKRPGVHDFTAEAVAWDGKPFKSPIYYGARVARWSEATPFGGMLDFTHSKAISRFADMVAFTGTLGGTPAPAKARIGEVFKHLEFSHGHNMLTLNGLYRLPRLAPRLAPYVGVGIGAALPHTEIALHQEPGRTYEYQYTGPVGQALIGLEIRAPGISYFIEYKFSVAAYEAPLTLQDGWLGVTDLWRQLQRWWRGETPDGGTASTTLASHQIIGGLGLRMVPATAAAGR